MNSVIKMFSGIIPLACVVILSILNSGCSLLPLPDSPKNWPDRSSNDTEPEPKPLHPALGTQEILGEATYIAPDGGRYFTQNKNPITGTLVDFHSNGQKRFEINYVNGLREGSAQWWTGSGQLQHIRNYHRGQLSGSWIQYHKDSEYKLQEQIYDNGIEIMRRGWWTSGMKRFEITFQNGQEQSRKSWDEFGSPTDEKASPNSAGSVPKK